MFKVTWSNLKNCRCLSSASDASYSIRRIYDVSIVTDGVPFFDAVLSVASFKTVDFDVAVFGVAVTPDVLGFGRLVSFDCVKKSLTDAVGRVGRGLSMNSPIITCDGQNAESINFS